MGLSNLCRGGTMYTVQTFLGKPVFMSCHFYTFAFFTMPSLRFEDKFKHYDNKVNQLQTCMLGKPTTLLQSNVLNRDSRNCKTQIGSKNTAKKYFNTKL